MSRNALMEEISYGGGSDCKKMWDELKPQIRKNDSDFHREWCYHLVSSKDVDVATDALAYHLANAYNGVSFGVNSTALTEFVKAHPDHPDKESLESAIDWMDWTKRKAYDSGFSFTFMGKVYELTAMPKVGYEFRPTIKNINS